MCHSFRAAYHGSFPCRRRFLRSSRFFNAEEREKEQKKNVAERRRMRAPLRMCVLPFIVFAFVRMASFGEKDIEKARAKVNANLGDIRNKEKRNEVYQRRKEELKKLLSKEKKKRKREAEILGDQASITWDELPSDAHFSSRSSSPLGTIPFHHRRVQSK